MWTPSTAGLAGLKENNTEKDKNNFFAIFSLTTKQVKSFKSKYKFSGLVYIHFFFYSLSILDFSLLLLGIYARNWHKTEQQLNLLNEQTRINKCFVWNVRLKRKFWNFYNSFFFFSLSFFSQSLKKLYISAIYEASIVILTLKKTLKNAPGHLVFYELFL